MNRFLSFTLLFCWFWILPAQAQLQRMEVAPVEASDQTVAVFPNHPDQSAVIIESTITSLRFSSNMNGIVEEMHEASRGRYVLILEPFTQILVIDAPGYIQQRLRIGSPQPREVRYFEVAPETQTSELISVIFNITPDDARLFVDGQQTPTNETVKLTQGSQSIRIEREGYRPVEEMVEISDQNILFTYQLEEIDIVPVQIRSNVEGASVTIDGTVRGEIDRSGGLGLFLYPGSYALSVSQTGYVTQNRTLEVSEEDRNEIRVDLVRNVGELELQVDPTQARVSLNRQDYSGQSLIELAPGRYRLDVESRGYKPYSETIEIRLNERIRREISLQPYLGSLQFSAIPSNAQVQLINRSGEIVNEWTGVELLRNLPVGSYTIRATADDHQETEREVQVLRDETLKVNLELKEGVLENWSRDTQTKVVEVTNPATGRTWMDRNLGASRAATSSGDRQAFGDLYQWGRGADGHQKRNSTTALFRSHPNQPTADSLWQGVNGTNNPCPEGFRVPTEAEWIAERSSWSSKSHRGAFSSLKLTLGGGRDIAGFGEIDNAGSWGIYWSSSVFGSSARHLIIHKNSAKMFNISRRVGLSVRCIKD